MLRSGTDRWVRLVARRTLDGPFRAKLRQTDHEGSATFSAVDLEEIVSHQCTPKQELGLAGRRDAVSEHQMLSRASDVDLAMVSLFRSIRMRVGAHPVTPMCLGRSSTIDHVVARQLEGLSTSAGDITPGVRSGARSRTSPVSHEEHHSGYSQPS